MRQTESIGQAVAEALEAILASLRASFTSLIVSALASHGRLFISIILMHFSTFSCKLEISLSERTLFKSCRTGYLGLLNSEAFFVMLYAPFYGRHLYTVLFI